MQDNAEAEEVRRRRIQAAQGLRGVPGYEGHWIGAVLFAATLIGATMLWSCLPMALAVVRGGSTGAADSRTAATFLTLYAAMAVGPIGGWTLWAFRRRWAALAVMALFAACVVWLAPTARL